MLRGCLYSYDVKRGFLSSMTPQRTINLGQRAGLRRITFNLMQIYDSPQNLVLLVNAIPNRDLASEWTSG